MLVQKIQKILKIKFISNAYKLTIYWILNLIFLCILTLFWLITTKIKETAEHKSCAKLRLQCFSLAERQNIALVQDDFKWLTNNISAKYTA